MNIENIKVSIIIPTYNRADTIIITLDSVLAQSFINWECIIVDDGSTDNSNDVIRNYIEKDTRFKYYTRTKKPKGAPTCRNIGLSEAKGKYIIFLDSDDYLLPNCIQDRCDSIANFPKNNFWIFPLGLKRNEDIVKMDIKKSDSYLVDFLSFDLSWQTMCPIWDANYIKRLNGFAEGYPRFNDPELMIRALAQPEVKFKAFRDSNFDCVYIPNKMDNAVFSDKIYKSLHLFVPDICAVLENTSHSDLKKYLVNYLKVWFVAGYFPLKEKRLKKSLDLISMFRKNNIYGFGEYSKICIYLFGYTYIPFLTSKFKTRLKATLTLKK